MLRPWLSELAVHATRRRKAYEWQAEDAYAESARTTPAFLRRFGRFLPIRGSTVLDFGCGLGALSFLLAELGAERVVGIDIDRAAIDAAEERRRDLPRALQRRIDFRTVEPVLRVGMADAPFDLIVSRDTFEHVLDPKAVLQRLAGSLAPDGTLALGMSPLWRSARGGHLAHVTWLPWAHLLLSEDVLMRRHREKTGGTARTFSDYGLNGLTAAEFRAIMTTTGLREEYLTLNAHESPWLRKAGLVGQRLGPMSPLFTASLYGVWTNSAS